MLIQLLGLAAATFVLLFIWSNMVHGFERRAYGKQARHFHTSLSAADKRHAKGLKVLAIVNPHGGAQTAVDIFEYLFRPMCEALNVTLSFEFTKHAGHAKAIAERVEASEKQECDLIVCLSGDGMFHEVMAGQWLVTSLLSQCRHLIKPSLCIYTPLCLLS